MGSSFSHGTCKIALRGCMERMVIVTNKKTILAKQTTKEIAQLLASGKESAARIKAEALINEENTMQAFEIMGLYCELVMVRLQLLESKEQCPEEMIEQIASIIYCAKRLDIKEFVDVANQFAMKFGSEFAKAHHENALGKVNPIIAQKLSVSPPSSEKLDEKLLDISCQFKLNWKPQVKKVDPLPISAQPSLVLQPQYAVQSQMTMQSQFVQPQQMVQMPQFCQPQPQMQYAPPSLQPCYAPASHLDAGVGTPELFLNAQYAPVSSSQNLGSPSAEAQPGMSPLASYDLPNPPSRFELPEVPSAPRKDVSSKSATVNQNGEIVFTRPNVADMKKSNASIVPSEDPELDELNRRLQKLRGN